MDEHSPGRAPDYTATCIVMFGVNLCWMMLLLFALWGLAAAVLFGLVLNHWIGWLQARKRLGT